MSFRGFGPSGSGGAGQGRDQGARKSFQPTSAFSWKTTKHYKGRGPIDRSGEELQATIRDVIGDSQDTEVQEALRHSYHALQDDQRPSTGVVINQVAQLVNLAGGNISPREAILRMARARFNYQAAAGDYLERLEDGSSPSLSFSKEGERDGDPGKVEGRGEGDRRVRADTDEESESSSAVCTIVVSL